MGKWWNRHRNQDVVWQDSEWKAFQEGVQAGRQQVTPFRCPCCGYSADLPAAEKRLFVQGWQAFWKSHPRLFTDLHKELMRRHVQASVPTRRDLSS